MIIKKYKSVFFSLFCLVLLLFNRSFAFALEVNYANNLGLPTPTNLETAISFWFQLAAYAAALIAIISFVIASLQLIWGGINPSLQKDAKDRMKNAAIGLFLSLASVIILKSINPSIADTDVTPVQPTTGIYYTNGSDYISAPVELSDLSAAPKGYDKLAYLCANPGRAILIWFFPKTNFNGNNSNYSGVKVVRKECNTQEPLPLEGSFRWSYESFGIYYCMGGCSETGTVCSGFMSSPRVSSETLSDPFKGKLSSVRIVNDLSNDIHYGILFHSSNDPADAGYCSDIYYSKDINKPIECFQNISVSQSSTVFVWNHKIVSDTSASGQGVDFYSEPYGWATGARAGRVSLNTNTIGTFWTGSGSSLYFSYTGIDRPSGYKQIYTNFSQRPGSVNIRGNYLLVLRSGSYCQIFFKNVYNVKSKEIYAATGNIGGVNIIPIK